MSFEKIIPTFLEQDDNLPVDPVLEAETNRVLAAEDFEYVAVPDLELAIQPPATSTPCAYSNPVSSLPRHPLVTKEDIAPLLERIIAFATSATSRLYWIKYRGDEEGEIVGEIRWYATTEKKDWFSILVYPEGFQVVPSKPNTGFWNDWNDPDHVQRTQNTILKFLTS